MLKYILGISLILNEVAQTTAACPFEKWKTYKNTQLIRHAQSGAYLFSTDNVHVDADGAPNAYHPDDVGIHCIRGTDFKGLDCPANGGYPNSSWWHTAIVPDPADTKKAYIQTDGEFKGYFVSKTSLMDKTRSDLDIRKYVDSTEVPYLVFPAGFHKLKSTGSLGDMGYALHLESGKSSPFIVADIGPNNAHLGEMSISLASALGGEDPNPRTGSGVPKGKVIYILFPKSRIAPAWPLSSADMNAKVEGMVKELGGIEVLKNCSNSH